MNSAARLQATLDLLTDVERTARPVDAVTSSFFRSRRFIDEQDRGAMLELLYALLRHQARLGWWLARLGHADSPRAQLLAWLILGQGRSPSNVARQFDGAKFAPAPLSDAERALLAGLRNHTIEHPEMPDAVRLECPDWAMAPLRQRFGGAFAKEMAATLTPPPLDLRVNPIRASRAEVLKGLHKLGLEAEATALSPNGIRLPERLSLARLPGLKTGEIEIQDEGSQLVALLVDAQPGERVVDFCAGAGGKTLALAAQMNNRGHLVACDVNESRLKRCAERLRKAGLHNAETRLLASETDKWVKRRKGGFDRVLVDAPCSGTGTWRRNPDARWRAPELGLEALIALQSRILASAARLVKPGGRLVYATCSLLPEENEAQVAAFLAANPAFRVVPLAEAAPNLTGLTPAEYLSLTPARHDTDGFFAAVLQRADQAPESA
ncbi:RsmB/NOP family class I SAM-dependent RNA methyltransferase [Thalassobius vesicularis]|uniref:RsmB/NOP family class I SAM-dependent RNA methyltransferase n=1 Tax=Thalassobius vesicularis TaxID=1294297 RepID=A0A4S3M9E8_9RHOB|nr:RsmB/NOP family class I SAM-dependent RNA methyltransferase [Thalassobius vesicularis]THD73237.1 RsmB/NOP family class I SAM-dependent RNA methyltransferase [Thalassobius vesicularis]